MKRWATLGAFLLVLVASIPVWARGGGGCFLPDSRIQKADGMEIPISTVRRGDELLAISTEGRTVHTKVRSVIRHKVDEYVLLKTDRQTLRVTAEHPFYTGNGTFRTLEVLKQGDTIVAWDGQALSQQRIVSLEKVRERVRVFNLQTDYPNTFFVGGIAVHNKGGGCFPAGTLIRTPSGQIPIEALSAGDAVQAAAPDGRIVAAGIEKYFATRGRVISIRADRFLLRATPDHPVAIPGGTFIEAGKLRAGHTVLVLNEGLIRPAVVIETSTQGPEEMVYNLSVSAPHTFLAANFVVHNKGGSSGRSGSSRSSSSSSSGRSRSRSSGSCDCKSCCEGKSTMACCKSCDCTAGDYTGLIFFFIFSAMAVIFVVIKKRQSKSENLDYLYSPSSVAAKTGKTQKLLEFLSRQDASVSLTQLRDLSEATFRKLQACWEKRDYGPMKPLLMEALFVQHVAQLRGLSGNHEINKIESLQVERVDIVNVRYTEKADQREFTALITASARDFYVDDRTDKYLRGDKKPARFQEFWTFQRTGEKWLLREIEQAGESDILKDENYVEMLTDQTVQGIYAEKAEDESKAGPWIEKGAEEKAMRIERLLNFLVKTDKLWSRPHMLERARQVFLNVFLAQESGDPDQAPKADLFGDAFESLREQIRKRQMEGIRIEYRNLCVRKAELILVKNYSDPAKDDFTVRISAHAQKIVRKGSQVLSEQQYVTPFDEYWTFGRMDNAWKLKEVLPSARGEKMLAQENVDEDSSSGQVQWYYRQTRAA